MGSTCPSDGGRSEDSAWVWGDLPGPLPVKDGSPPIPEDSLWHLGLCLKKVHLSSLCLQDHHTHFLEAPGGCQVFLGQSHVSRSCFPALGRPQNSLMTQKGHTWLEAPPAWLGGLSLRAVTGTVHSSADPHLWVSSTPAPGLGPGGGRGSTSSSGPACPTLTGCAAECPGLWGPCRELPQLAPHSWEGTRERGREWLFRPSPSSADAGTWAWSASISGPAWPRPLCSGCPGLQGTGLWTWDQIRTLTLIGWGTLLTCCLSPCAHLVKGVVVPTLQLHKTVLMQGLSPSTRCLVSAGSWHLCVPLLLPGPPVVPRGRG